MRDDEALLKWLKRQGSSLEITKAIVTKAADWLGDFDTSFAKDN
jgi:hypothetical protein